jgi:periplasmic protein CpxP/Spy
MNTKATILLGVLISAGSLLAQAPDANQPTASTAPQAAQTQSNNPHAQRDPARQAAHMAKQLGLSSDQVAQITPILADRQQQLQNLRTDTSLRPRARRIKAKEILKDSTVKLEAVMNDTQKQQYEQMIADRRSHHNRHPQA